MSSLVKGIREMFTTPDTPAITPPTALSTVPDPKMEAQKAKEKQVEDERARASTSATLTSGGGAGLSDEPETTSATLMGS